MMIRNLLHNRLKETLLISAAMACMAAGAFAQNAMPVPSLNELGDESLPAVTMPTTPPAATATPPKSVPAAAPTQVVSVGGFGQSIMYLPEDIANMTRILQAYEGSQQGRPTQVATTGDEDILSELLQGVGTDEEKAEEIIEDHQDYYLSSIVYRAPGNWAVWINRERFTSHDKQDENAVRAVSIRGISRDMITLGWVPKDVPRAKALWEQRKESKESVYRHRAALQTAVDFDEEQSMFLVTLRPNQTFSTQNMDVLEGRAAPVVAQEAVPVEEAPVVTPVVEEVPSGAGDDDLSSEERQIAEELMRSIRKIQKFTPERNTPPAVAPQAPAVPVDAADPVINDLIEGETP